MATYFISDTHFGHKNILKYDNCPHANLEEYNNDIITKWNNTVKDTDIVWFLGDLAMTNNKQVLTEYISKLNGKKFMIKGNHDNRPTSFYREAGFIECYDHPIILKGFFILSHEPMYMTPDMPYFNIYGHVHIHPAYITKTPNTMCVCACRHNYTPVRIPAYDTYQKPEDTVNKELEELCHGATGEENDILERVPVC